MKKHKAVNKITCKRHFDDFNSKLTFEAYDKHGCRVETFDHYYKWHDEDDLCVKMQEKIEISSAEFSKMWENVQNLWLLIIKAKKPVVVFSKEK